jgi:hypothetical protein
MTSGPADSVSHQDAVRRLERLADRLRVVGPRLAARQDPAARDLLVAIRGGLQRLADLAADADGEPRRVVPELAGHALADQALVLGHELLGVPDKWVAPGEFAVSDVRSEPEGAGLLNPQTGPDGSIGPTAPVGPSGLVGLGGVGRSVARSEQDRVNAISIVAEIRDLI